MTISLSGTDGVTTPAVLGGALPQIADYVRGLAGSVVQVVSATMTSTFTTTSSSYVDVTGLTLNITPASTSNKVLILVSFEAEAVRTGDDVYSQFGLFNSSTEIDLRWIYHQSSGSTFTSSQQSVVFVTMHSPNATTSQTYKIRALTGIGSGSETKVFTTSPFNFASILALEIVA